MSHQLHQVFILSLGKDLLIKVGGGWVAPRACLDCSEKTKIFLPLPGNKSQFVELTFHSLITILTELLQFVVTCFKVLNPQND